MIMGLYSAEQDFLTIEQFISNFKREHDKKLSIIDILDFFENKKISLFLSVKKDENEIRIASSTFKKTEISARHSRDQLNKSTLFHSDKRMEKMNDGLFQFNRKDYIKEDYTSLYSEKNTFHNISGITNNKLFYKKPSEKTSTNLYTNKKEKINLWEEQEIHILEDCFYSGYFKIPQRRINLGFLLKPEMIPEKVRVIIEHLLPELELCSHYEITGNEDTEDGYKTSLINIFIPNYLDKLKIAPLKDLYISKDDIEKIRKDLNLLSILDTRPPQIPEKITPEIGKLKDDNALLYSIIDSKNQEILALEEKNKELIKHKNKSVLIERDKMLSSHQTIIKGLLLVIDKMHNKKRVFTSPKKRISPNEISKEILTIIEENPNDFLDEKIGDSTIRKYLRNSLKEMEDK